MRGADTVPTRSRGYDAGKKVNGPKRHIAVDTGGLLLAVVATVAGLQDRDAGHRLLTALRARFSTVSLVWADGGYAGRLVVWAKAVLTLGVEIVKRTDDLAGFHVLPRRWVGGGGLRRRAGPAGRRRGAVSRADQQPVGRVSIPGEAVHPTWVCDAVGDHRGRQATHLHRPADGAAPPGRGGLRHRTDSAVR